jgi:hypothetical protein
MNICSRHTGTQTAQKQILFASLSGELPPRVVRAASAWIAEEQGDEMEAEAHSGHAVSLGPEPISVGFTGSQA